MQDNIIGSCGLGVKLEVKGLASERLWKEILENKLLYRFIPNFMEEGQIIATLQVINSLGPKEIEFGLSKSFISGTYGKDFNSTDIIVLAEYILERHRQERGIYTIHSSSIYKGNNGILLLANLTGAGKTSAALYFTNKLGFFLYSDEKTLVSAQKKLLVGQTQKIYLEDKTVEALANIGVESEREISIPKAREKNLSGIVIPLVTDHLATPVVKKYAQDQLKWLLYEEFSKDIRLVNGMIFNMSMPLMPLDTRELAQERLNRSIELSEIIPCYFIQGSLSQIGELVEELILKPL